MHWLPLQALPGLHSVEVVQPHPPSDRHSVPFIVVQSLHVPPAVPQAAPASPATQVVPLQHPPLHAV